MMVPMLEATPENVAASAMLLCDRLDARVEHMAAIASVVMHAANRAGCGPMDREWYEAMREAIVESFRKRGSPLSMYHDENLSRYFEDVARWMGQERMRQMAIEMARTIGILRCDRT